MVTTSHALSGVEAGENRRGAIESLGHGGFSGTRF
jgi:hypothetical protein